MRRAAVAALLLLAACRPDEQTWSLTNLSRAAFGVPTLKADAELVAHAEAHARALAEAGDLWHSDLYPLLDVRLAAGEIVGNGAHPASVWQAFLTSPDHAAVIRNPRWDTYGVGVVATGPMLFVVVVFGDVE